MRCEIRRRWHAEGSEFLIVIKHAVDINNIGEIAARKIEFRELAPSQKNAQSIRVTLDVYLHVAENDIVTERK